MDRRKENKISRVLLIAMFLSAVLIGVAFIVFAKVSGKDIRENNHQYLINDTNQAAANIDYAILEGYNNIQIFSKLLGDSLQSPEVDISNYQRLINDSVFDFMEFADKDGMDHNITGGVSDARDRKYYLDAMNGNSGIEVIYNSRATHESLVMFYSPVYYDGEIIGSLIGVYQASNRLSELLQLDYFGEKAKAYLCTSDGRVFASSEDLDFNTEIYIDGAINADGANTNTIKNAIINNESASFFVSDNEASGYITKLLNSDWYLVQIYPYKVNLQMMDRTNKIGLGLIAFLLFVFACLLLAVYHIHVAQQRKIEVALVETEMARDEEEKQLEILQSMADIYYSMHLINLEQNRMVEYHSQNQVKDVVASYNGATANVIMNNVMHATMSDDDLQKGLDFSNVLTVGERLRGKKYISMDLHGRNVGWIRMAFITINANEDGMPVNVICTTQIIDELKKKEEKLFRESYTDALTGCYNRRAYEDDILSCPDIPEEKDYVYVAMDINGLKKVNDKIGHDAGDELILGAVKCMNQCLGNYGKLYRVGGDEFVAMIFANEQILEDIKRDFEEVQRNWNGKLVSELSVSCGYVSKREYPNKKVTELAKIADKLMYEEKAKYYEIKGTDRRGV